MEPRWRSSRSGRAAIVTRSARRWRTRTPDLVATSWSDALSTSEGARGRGAGTRFGMDRLIDSRAVTVAALPERAFTPIRRIGGARWRYDANARSGRLRGVADRMLGCVGT